MEELEKALSKTNISDYQINSFDGNTLVMVGSFDLAYYYEVKLTFYSVDYINCPTYFGIERIRFATEEERNKNKNNSMIEPEDLMIVFEHNTFNQLYFIICEDFNYEFGVKDIKDN